MAWGVTLPSIYLRGACFTRLPADNLNDLMLSIHNGFLSEKRALRFATAFLF
jgi:hypothetical protein